MLALRAALAAYRDGWRRVLAAPWLLAGLIAAGAAIVLPGAWDESELASRSATFAGDVTMALGSALDRAIDAPELLGRNGSAAGWLLTVAAIALGACLGGGVLDRYARQRPVDARTFWGVCGELGGRLLRLEAAGMAGLLVLEGLLSWLPVGGVGHVQAGVGSWEFGFDPRTLMLQDILRFPVLLAGFALLDCARVRIVVERRRSVLFAIAAGARFAWRHAGALLVLYGLLMLTLGVIVSLLLLAGAAAVSLAGGSDTAFSASDQLLSVGLVVPALVSGASLTALFQAALAHAAYVAPPRLVWPDSPAVETLGEPRDFPPSV